MDFFVKVCGRNQIVAKKDIKFEEAHNRSLVQRKDVTLTIEEILESLLEIHNRSWVVCIEGKLE